MQNTPSDLFEDVEQKVLIKLWKNLPEFKLNQEKGKFRTWMSRVIKNTLIDEIRSHKTRSQSNQKFQEEFIHQNNQSSELEELVEEEWKIYLTHKALEKVKVKFKGKAIQVFELSMDGEDAETIASQLDLKKNTVYRLKKRVQVALREEIQALQHLLEGTDHVSS